MSKEKQIEEMARAMCSFSKNTLCRECSDECFYKDYAERAYNAGYRKQAWISVDERLPEDKQICLAYGTVYYVPDDEGEEIFTT